MLKEGYCGIEVGDNVAFDFEVNWDAEFPGTITAIKKLPADIKLSSEFE